MLGVLTEVTVKILKKPQSVKALLLGFQSVEDSGQCVSDIISGGIIPAGMEKADLESGLTKTETVQMQPGKKLTLSM